jgi:hypothetical protein
MRTVVRKIDRALKDLYRLDAKYNAEEFLIKKPYVSHVSRGIYLDKMAANAALQGALFIRPGRPASEISLGIYLSEGVRRNLLSFRRWPKSGWSWEQVDAFSVAAEEVSHFQYLVFHASAGRGVSQLELELQGEIDKFLLTYFAVMAGRQFDEKIFGSLFEQFFFRFHLAANLSEEQRARYIQANNFAKHFIRRCEGYLARPGGHERVLRLLRRFYRMSAHEKMSLAG